MTAADGFAASPQPLPSGYHCAITWSIPDDFGGMTNAMLHRSRAFLAEGHQNVDILTFNFEMSLDEIRCELNANGALIKGIALRNLWDDLSGLPDGVLAQAVSGKSVAGEYSSVTEGDSYTEVVSDLGQMRRTRFDSTGSVALQVDYLRSDGTVFVSDRLDRKEKGVLGGRLVSLCDTSGRAVASWNQMWPLYLYWLDVVVAGRETFMIIDSKFAANFMTRYRRDNVVTLHQLHSAHVPDPPHGEMSAQRKYTFDRLHMFDAVVLLTQRQKDDVNLVYGAMDNTCVVPNSRTVACSSGRLEERSRRSGLTLARFTALKRLDHAIRAVKIANNQSMDSFELDIYGGGSQKSSLERLIETESLQSTVRLSDYDPNAGRGFKNASFTLLTSRSEGLPLVLLEAMNAGCIPIAYDIAYGPADIITDGENGFLVDEGDVDGLANKMLRLESMSAKELDQMRMSAIARALDFSDAAVVGQWGRAMREAVDRKLTVSLKSARLG